MADERKSSNGAQDLDDLTVLQRTDGTDLGAEEHERQGYDGDSGEDLQTLASLHTGSQTTQDEINRNLPLGGAGFDGQTDPTGGAGEGSRTEGSGASGQTSEGTGGNNQLGNGNGAGVGNTGSGSGTNRDDNASATGEGARFGAGAGDGTGPQARQTETPESNDSGTSGSQESGGSGGSDEDIFFASEENAIPDAGDDEFSLDEDNVTTFSMSDLLANDTDANGDSLIITAVGDAAHGIVSFDPETGEVTYTPDENYNGADSFTYTISDGNGGFSTATVSLTVDPVNDNPVTVDDVVSGSEDNVMTFSAASILGNDSDLDGDSLSVDSFTQPEGGTLTLEDGTFTFTPNENWNGETGFDYTVTDGNGGTATGSVALNVAAVNDGPEAADDNATTDYRTAITINVLANDSDLDGDSLTIDGVSGLSYGTVEIVDGQLVYTPVDEFSGEETFTYTISDGNGGTTTATVTVDVAAGTVFSDGDDNVDLNQISAENYQDGQQYASGDGADTVTLADTDVQAEHGFDGGEQFSAGAGNDTVIGGDGADNVDGGADNDLISGGAGDDTLAGGAGDDTITGGAGDDTITGGEGTGDKAIYSGNRADYTVIGNEDGSYTIIDNVAGRDGSDQVWGIESFQFADGTIGIDDLIPEEMFTENGENVILPNTNADYGTTESYDALGGDDTVTGGNLGDTISGGGGNDTIFGGAGNDVLNGDAPANTLTVRLGGEAYNGNPNYRIVVDGEVVAQGEVTWSRDTVSDGTYGSMQDVVWQDIAITLPEGTSPDSVQIQFTNDSYRQGVGDRNLLVDSISFNGTVLEAETDGDYGNRASSERMSWSGTMTFDVSGIATANDAGSDMLTGGAGNDTLVGGAGTDTAVYSGNYEDYQVVQNEDGSFTITDTVDGRDGADTISGVENFQFADVTYSSGQLVELMGFHIIGDQHQNVLNGGDGGDTIEARGNNDSVEGGGGSDTIYGEGGADVIDAGDGDDIVDGGTGNDLIEGGAGNDYLRGNHGADTLHGGDGDDTLVLEGNAGRDQFDELHGGDGTDRVMAINDGNLAFDNFSAGNSIEIVDGGSTASQILGNNNANTLDFSNSTLVNISRIDSGRGNDSVTGSSGDDSIFAGDNNDTVHGGAGNDIIDGGNHDDIINGGAGDDHLRGNHGTDTIFGGSGNDTIYLEGNASRDQYDHLDGGEGIDTVKALNDGDMTFDGFYGNNSIEVVDGGTSASKIKGNNSANTLDFSNSTLINISEIDAGRGNDTVTGSAGDDSIDGGDNNDTVHGGAGNDTIDGGAHDDILYGDEGNDILRGGHGNDTLYGGDGDDTLVLEGRADRDQKDELHGGDGTDTVMAENDGDLIFDNFSADNSIEVVHGGNSASQVEGNNSDNNLDFSNSTLVNISRIDAGRGDDTVTGTAGDDSIYGGDGNDTLSGGAGDDHLEGGHGNDLFIFKLGGGNDSISGGDGWTDTVRMEGVDSGPSEGANASWTLHLDQGEIVEQGVDEDGKEYIRLTEDASGHIETSDGEHVEFTGVERFEW